MSISQGRRGLEESGASGELRKETSPRRRRGFEESDAIGGFRKESLPRGIIVFGANGGGKTTLASELARVLRYTHMDIEAYAFRESEIPYADERPREACIALLRADIEKHRAFVLSAVTGDFGDTIPLYYALGVFVTAPVEIRMRRIERRAGATRGAHPAGRRYVRAEPGVSGFRGFAFPGQNRTMGGDACVPRHPRGWHGGLAHKRGEHSQEV